MGILYEDRQPLNAWQPWTTLAEQLATPDYVGDMCPDIEFYGPEIIPVIGRAVSEVGRTRHAIDRSVEIVTGDMPDPLTPFEQATADYTGIDSRVTPVCSYDDDLSRFYG